MQSETSNGLVLILIGRGSGQATYANSLHLRLQLAGAWVTLQIKHLTDEHVRDTRYQTRFPVHVLHGTACVDRAQIDLYEAPLLTGSYLPEVEGLDTAFTQLFQTFLRYHRQELMQIAWDLCAQSERERQRLSYTVGGRMAA